MASPKGNQGILLRLWSRYPMFPFYLVIIAPVILIFLLIQGMKLWEVAYGTHEKAVITKVWKEHYRGSIQIWAHITFKGIDSGANPMCEADVDAGWQGDGLMVGSQIYIVPRTGGCFKPLVPRIVESWGGFG